MEDYTHAEHMKMPEDWTPIGEWEMSGAPWEFDLIALWRDGEGLLRAAHDSGCSCPIPFEGFTATDFQCIRTTQDFEVFVSNHEFEWWSLDAKQRVRAAVRSALREG